MKIELEGMFDTKRYILMLQGEVFIWHIQKHLDNHDTGLQINKLPKGVVGCCICGKTVEQIFNGQKDEYYQDMGKKYGDKHDKQR